MTSYHVTFFKNLVNSNGHQFKCPQGTMEVQRARSPERALRAAERRFERANKIGNWTLYADVAEVDAIGSDGSSRRFVQPASRERHTIRPCEKRPR